MSDSKNTPEPTAEEQMDSYAGDEESGEQRVGSLGALLREMFDPRTPEQKAEDEAIDKMLAETTTSIIYKYELPLVDRGELRVRVGAKAFKLMLQNDKICIWAVVPNNPALPERVATYAIVGTGYAFDTDMLEKYRYFDTVQQGSMVWHVFVGEAGRVSNG